MYAFGRKSSLILGVNQDAIKGSVNWEAKKKLSDWRLLARSVFEYKKRSCDFSQLLNLISQMYGVPKGIRTPVAAVKGQCPRPTRRWGPRSNAANHINKYNRVNILKNGAPTWTRTRGPRIKSPLLYQLSYRRIQHKNELK